MAARTGNPSLTEDELAGLQTALSEGRRATVYLREPIPSLDLAAGSSARVISIVGGSLMVKPRGVDDEISFEAEELRLTRRAPEPPAKKAPAKKAPAKKSAAAKKTPAKSAAARKTPTAPAARAPATVPTGGSARPAGSAKRSAPARTAATESAAPADQAAQAPVVKKSAPAKKSVAPAAGQSAGRRRTPATVSVVLEGDVESGWTVAVQRGARRVARPVEVGPQEVLAALRELGDQTAIDEAETLMAAARAQAAQRVDALAAELERARRELDELGAPE